MSSALNPQRESSIDPTLTMDELRCKLQSHLKKSGALTSLKTQLRAMVLTEVTQKRLNDGNQQLQHAVTKPGGGGFAARNAYASRLADELVEAHLRATYRSFSHSIFTSEANLAPLGGGGGAYGRDADLAAALDVPFNHEDPSRSGNYSILCHLIERSLKRRSQRALVSREGGGGTVVAGGGTGGTAAVLLYDFQDGATQTSESELLRNGTLPSYHTLEQKLSLVDAEHALRLSHVDFSTSASLEMRMKQHKEDLELVMQRELERRYQQFRAKELAAVRAEEHEKYQHLMRFKEEEKREFERSVEYRMQLERERMEQMKLDLAMQREAMEKRSHDVIALSREREQSATFLERALEEKKGTLAKLQSQLSRLEEICADRSNELETYKLREGRRLAEMQRQQRDHLAELNMRDNEIAETKYRLKVVAEEYKNNIDRLTLDYARGPQTANHQMPEDWKRGRNSATVVDPFTNQQGKLLEGASLQELFAKHDVRPQLQSAPTITNHDTVAPTYEGRTLTSVPVSTVSSKYLPPTTNATHREEMKAAVASPAPAATAGNHVQRSTALPQQQSPSDKTPVRASNINTSTPRPSSAQRPTSPLPRRDKKPSPSVSSESSTHRSRSPMVTGEAQHHHHRSTASRAEEASLSASPIGAERSSDRGGDNNRSASPSTAASSVRSEPINRGVANSNDDTAASPNGSIVRQQDQQNSKGSSLTPSASRSRTSSSPGSSSRKRRPVLDSVKERQREEAARQLETLEITEEVNGRQELVAMEAAAFVLLIGGLIIDTVAAAGPLWQEENRQSKQLLWDYNRGMDTLRISRAAGRRGATESATSYVPPPVTLVRDSDSDVSDDVGLFRNRSDDESDF